MKFVKTFISMLIICTILIVSCNAYSSEYMGDLNNDMDFNSIDLVLFRKQLQSATPVTFSEILDFNVDGTIDLRDLIRMKKYLVGDITHIVQSDKGFTWMVLNGTESISILTSIGYMFSTTCYVKTVCAPGRCVWETSAFIKTDKYINPEYPKPTLNIANATVNDEFVSMSPYNNVIVSPDWIWECSFSEDIFYVPTRSNFKCLFTIMLEGSSTPYREIEINYEF